MNKSEIIKAYKAFLKAEKVQAKDFVVGAGAACVMYGVREETNDIDTNVPLQLWNRLLNNGDYKTHYFGETLVLEYNDKIDVHLKESDHKTETVDGVTCYSKQELLDQKLRLNRPKDQEDIRKLKILLKAE